MRYRGWEIAGPTCDVSSSVTASPLLKGLNCGPIIPGAEDYLFALAAIGRGKSERKLSPGGE
jgi:hypothetical protein